MTAKSLAFLACRLFALYVFAQLFVWVVYIWNPARLDAAFTAGDYASFAVVPVASLMLGLLFWCKADWLAGKLVGRHAVQALSTDIKPETMQAVGFSIVGMFLLAEAIPGITYRLLIMHHDANTHTDAFSLYALIRWGLMLALGIGLIFSGSSLARIIAKLRSCAPADE